MRAIELLLENRWILRNKDREKYYYLRDNIEEIKKFIQDKLGYQIIINHNLIKMDKIPCDPAPWMGIKQFVSKIEYSLLCIILMFLEDKEPEEQFVLSQITEYIQAVYQGEEKIDWTLYAHRRHLIKVLRYCEEKSLILTNDGNDDGFIKSNDTEVLYENTGNSKYFTRVFSKDIMNFNSYYDFNNMEWEDLEQNKGPVRRRRVYRKLFMSPAILNKGKDDSDYDYIKKNRAVLEADVDKYLESRLHIHKNSAFIMLDESKNYKQTFPNNTNISDIILLLNSIIREKIEKKELNTNILGEINVSEAYFEEMIEDLCKEFSNGFSKMYREMSLNQLKEEIINNMENLYMLKYNKSNRTITIYSTAGKLTGTYPKDFIEKNKKEKENE